MLLFCFNWMLYGGLVVLGCRFVRCGVDRLLIVSLICCAVWVACLIVIIVRLCCG